MLSKTRKLALRIALPAVCALVPIQASAQQRPPSIDSWLRAERNNENLQNAYREYDRVNYGPAAVPRAPQGVQQIPVQTYQQPQQVQPQQVQPQQPPQWLPPNTNTVQQQQPVQPNTYETSPNALEKIDREYSRDTFTGGASSPGWFVSADVGLPLVFDQEYSSATTGAEAEFEPLAIYLGGGVGYRLTDHISVGGEGSFQYAPYDEQGVDGGVSVYALMANATLHFDSGTKFQPYVTGGLGLADHNVSGTNAGADGDDIVLAFQVGTGVLIPFGSQTSLNLGYKYFRLSDADISSSIGDYTAAYSSHIFMTGLKHQF